MTLTNEQQQQVINVLNGRNLGSKGCHMCGAKNSWQLEPVIYEAREFTGGPVTTEGAILPAIVLSCGSCGNTVFLSAIRLGVLVPMENEEEGGEKREDNE